MNEPSSYIIIPEWLEEVFSTIANKELEELRYRACIPYSQVQLHIEEHKKTNYVMFALTALWSASDAVELVLVFRIVNGTFFCEATLFIGQHTLLSLDSCLWRSNIPDQTLESCFWRNGLPEQKELEETVRDFVAVLSPRFVTTIMELKPKTFF